MLLDLLEPFLFLDQLQINSSEKNTLEKMWKLWGPPFKISRYATDTKPSTIFRFFAEDIKING